MRTLKLALFPCPAGACGRLRRRGGGGEGQGPAGAGGQGRARHHHPLRRDDRGGRNRPGQRAGDPVRAGHRAARPAGLRRRRLRPPRPGRSPSSPRARRAAQLAEAQARQREAQQQLSRIQTLKQRGFATQSQLDVQNAAAAAARAQASGVRASIGERVITAPFSGYASLRTISPGAVVNSAAPRSRRSATSRRSSSISRCPRPCSRRSARASPSRPSRRPIPTSPSAARSPISIR